jgi:hypothetical protein
MDSDTNNKLDFVKTLLPNSTAESDQQFHCVLLYTGTDQSGKPLEQNLNLENYGLECQTLLDYHFQTLFKNSLFDICIVAYKEIATGIMKHTLSKEMMKVMNIRIFVLEQMEDSTINAMKLISPHLTKELLIIHGNFLIDMNLKDAIAVHLLNDSDMTIVLKKQGELEKQISKQNADNSSTKSTQFNIYGLAKNESRSSSEIVKSSFEVYAMFNNFEVVDTSGLSVSRKILRKCPSGNILLHSDLNDTGVYILPNIFPSLPDLETIEFDLVKMMVNGQHKRKLTRMLNIDKEKATIMA